MAISPTLKQSGALSMSFRFASVSGTDTVSNEALLAICPRGDLYALLSALYADMQAFLDAWAAAGGLMSLQSTSASTAASWTLSSGAPQLTVVDSAASQCAVRMALSYSASR